MIVTSHHWKHFGDVWMSINAALTYAKGKPITVKPKHNYKLAIEIKELLRDADNLTILPYDGIYDISIFKPSFWVYQKTKVQWKFGPYKRICYQLDGARYRATQKTPPDVDRILNSIGYRNIKIEKIKIGKPLSLSEIVQIVSKSDLFVGLDSGMSHLCYSTNIPMFLVEHNHKLSLAHKNKKFTKCIGINDTIEKINTYMNKIYK
jgi:ADP-heptose:LPS heptosyltransferase